jgi:dinuclear metal center YbgI/SA1388 family protein
MNTVCVGDIVGELERMAPLAYQENYDNAGLTVGSRDMRATGALLCFDVTEGIIDEAVERGANLVISHHPAIFGGLKRLTGATSTERIVAKALRSDVALYAAHTNLDSVQGGINTTLAARLGLSDVRILVPKEQTLFKLVTFVPDASAGAVRQAMFDAGAGCIGNYDRCSYNLDGRGTFRAGEGTNPFVGERGELHCEPEVRIETVTEKHKLAACIAALRASHPYEEPAFDVYRLENSYHGAGTGAVGHLQSEVDAADFLRTVKKVLPVKVIRHNALFKKVRTVAVCGGAGAEYIGAAIAAKADIYVTGDCKYHQFADSAGRIILADTGHFESECFAVELFYEAISKKFPTFALCFARGSSNPVQYF